MTEEPPKKVQALSSEATEPAVTRSDLSLTLPKEDDATSSVGKKQPLIEVASSDTLVVDSGQESSKDTAPDDSQRTEAASTLPSVVEQATVVDETSLPVAMLDAEINALERELSMKENKSPTNNDASSNLNDKSPEVVDAPTMSPGCKENLVSQDAPTLKDDQ